MVRAEEQVDFRQSQAEQFGGVFFGQSTSVSFFSFDKRNERIGGGILSGHRRDEDDFLDSVFHFQAPQAAPAINPVRTTPLMTFFNCDSLIVPAVRSVRRFPGAELPCFSLAFARRFEK